MADLETVKNLTMMTNVEESDVGHEGRLIMSGKKWKTDQNHNYSEIDENGTFSQDMDLTERLRQSENEKIAVIMDHNDMMRKCNEKIDSQLHEFRVVQEHNRALENSLNELQELCCYLDDDRKNCRRVAKEWQRFGRYTVTVMRNEVISYSDKLKNLEGKQNDLMKENGELRDLCVYLDKSRKSEDSNGIQGQQGNALKFVICSECKRLRKDNEDPELSPGEPDFFPDKRNGIDQSLKDEYVSKLESRIRQLEEEREFFITTFASKKTSKDKKRVSFSVPEDDCDSSSLSEQDRGDMELPIRPPPFRTDSQHGILRNGFLSPPPRKSEPKQQLLTVDASDKVTQAMRVLEIQEKLERGSTSSNGSEEPLTEPEVAILKQMCNAAWSKLGDDHDVPLPTVLPNSDINEFRKEN